MATGIVRNAPRRRLAFHRISLRQILIYCFTNFKKFLHTTTLHGLKFVADNSISIWERLFFLCSFIAALATTANLISNIYTKWDSTPVIIGISPHPTSVVKVPFPAITVCNMNLVSKSKVINYTEDSYEGTVLKMICELDNDANLKSNIRNNTLSISDFIVTHGQPCSRMFLSCELSSTIHNCGDLFREVITDEGLCCAFNILHPNFLYKGDFNIIKDYTSRVGIIPVDWNPETGYGENLPENYYPRLATGTGVSMGLSITLNAELDDYYCSSTNGPGFKVSLHNPIEMPAIKETGLIVPTGYETRFRIDAQRSEAAPTIRSIDRKRRQCIFALEQPLIYYKYYTRRNCESECEAISIYKVCGCIPYKLPLLFPNASLCLARDNFCVDRAEKLWIANMEEDYECRQQCLPSCFDLSFVPNSFAIPLATRNYTIPSAILRHMSKDYASKNVAVIHFYYRESVFYGDLKNVYIGLTEFLSNTGGIMGLFMGFSFISLAEIFYFAILLPLFDNFLPKSRKGIKLNEGLIEIKASPHPGKVIEGTRQKRAPKLKRNPLTVYSDEYPNEVTLRNWESIVNKY